MARLTYRRRKKLPGKAFALPGRRFPIHDKAHARAALSRAAQKKTRLTPTERCKVVHAVCSRYPDIATCEGTGTSRKLNVCVR